MIRTLIVDDEPMARASIRVLLGGDPDIVVVGECASGHAAVSAIAAQEPDLLFLDVEMPNMTAFDVLGAIDRRREMAIVFVTAFEDYALEAFDVGAHDYVLKPFDDRRFARALERAKQQIRRSRLDALATQLMTVAAPPRDRARAPEADDTRIALRDGERTVFVLLSEIDWIEAYDYYVQIHAGAKQYLLRESMRDLELQLDPNRFLRIHRSSIVAIDRIVEVKPVPTGDYKVRLSTGTELKLSRARRDRLRALLRRW